MQAASPFDDSALQPRQGLLRSYALALLVHGLLLAALTWGVSWRRSDTSLAIEAELWSAMPQQAAPRAVETAPQPEPAPPPPAPPKVADPGEAEIALQREREQQAKQRAEEEHREKQRLERERQEKQERDKKLAEEKRRKEAEAKRKEQQEAAEREKLRQENIKRMAGLAGASGAPTASGTATQSSGPSASYAARIKARVKPNIAFNDDVVGNPEAVVRIRTSPDGTILVGDSNGPRLITSSGNKAWDEAVLKAIIKTDRLPLNEDGVVPTPIDLVFRPKD
ncbi:MAG: cell envelope integrity protein TolA [bacterium]|jgi:colicin import membrane protein|nr:cell envelope integrity protein TolA [Curvibacter sp.]